MYKSHRSSIPRIDLVRLASGPAHCSQRFGSTADARLRVVFQQLQYRQGGWRGLAAISAKQGLYHGLGMRNSPVLAARGSPALLGPGDVILVVLPKVPKES